MTWRRNMDGNLLVPNSSKVTERLLGVYLVVLIFSFTYLLIEFWPTVAAQAGGEQGWANTVTLWFGPRSRSMTTSAAAHRHSRRRRRQLHPCRDVVRPYVGNQSFVASWTWWYLLRPFIGMALALVSIS